MSESRRARLAIQVAANVVLAVLSWACGAKEPAKGPNAEPVMDATTRETALQSLATMKAAFPGNADALDDALAAIGEAFAHFHPDTHGHKTWDEAVASEALKGPPATGNSVDRPDSIRSRIHGRTATQIIAAGSRARDSVRSGSRREAERDRERAQAAAAAAERYSHVYSEPITISPEERTAALKLFVVESASAIPAEGSTRRHGQLVLGVHNGTSYHILEAEIGLRQEGGVLNRSFRIPCAHDRGIPPGTRAEMNCGEDNFELAKQPASEFHALGWPCP